MISVILTILKIIGIIILVTLGVIFTTLILVLFVPIRYRSEGRYKDKSITINGQISWLMHLISVRLLYKNGDAFHMKVKLLGLTIYDNLKAASKKERKKSKKLKGNSSIEISNEETLTDDLSSDNEIIAASKRSTEIHHDDTQTTIADNTDNIQHENTEFEKKPDTNNVIDEECKEKNTLFENILIKINIIIDKIKYTLKKIYDTIIKIKSNAEYYSKLFKHERTKKALQKCKIGLIRILKNLNPQKYQINLHLGFSNPETLGRILAVSGMLYPLHLGRVDILPEFEQEIIEGEFNIKGKLNIYVYVWTAITLIFDKNIRWVLKHLKNTVETKVA